MSKSRPLSWKEHLTYILWAVALVCSLAAYQGQNRALERSAAPALGRIPILRVLING